MTPTGPEYLYVEKPSIRLLEQLGWVSVDAFQEKMGSRGTLGRDSERDVILPHRLKQAMRELNQSNTPDSVNTPEVPDAAIDEAIEALTKDRSAMDPVRASREVYELLRNGYLAQWRDASGSNQTALLQYLNFQTPADNDLLAVQQMWIAGKYHRRRPDVVLFVNGIPLVLMEFKEPNQSVKTGFDDNITDYRDTIPQLFTPNCFVLISNGRDTKIGSTFVSYDFFNDWKITDAQGTRTKTSIETALHETCNPNALLDLFENFVSYMERPGGMIKVVARAHQYYGVNAAIANMIRARAERDKRLGVFWHTQGSGKTLSMLWFTQKVLRSIPGNWTFVMVTDRKELDVQLYKEFASAGAIPPETKVHADTGAHLRELLAADHRYVFTLIHKFQPSKALGESVMPVLSERSDVIVITDEAHRSQYDTLALNMRAALPNASMMGFTGTPLIQGEEQATREQFGDYVSIYNFRDAIEDGATVPLYYENRIPELQLVNENFSDELNDLLEEAELDDDAEGQLTREFGTQYMLLTRPERLKTIAKDLVKHFVGRGFSGKAMYVGLDKPSAVRMYGFVQEAWSEYLAELKTKHDALPELERPWLASRVELMETTDMAVVVSQSQNELKTLDAQGLDIRPHRERMNNEDLAEKFKDPEDPLRIVFVCAMWMTGFDAPSVSTIYLDRPMRNHTLMQTIARANRVFPDKDNGLIVDYVGVFRNLEKALAIYGSADTEDPPILNLDELADELENAVGDLFSFCSEVGADLGFVRDADGFDYITHLDDAVEKLLVNTETQTEFQLKARTVRRLFKALLPDERAVAQQRNVSTIRKITERIADVTRPPQADLGRTRDAVDALLDRSVGAEEYLIRVAAEGSKEDPFIDLGQIDFEELTKRLSGRKRAETDRLAQLLKQRALRCAMKNPTRHELVERIERLIDEYNEGSINSDEYLRRLVELSKTLNEEEGRVVREGLTEEELAIFDLLTRPVPVLTEKERDVVKAGAKKLLSHLHEKLVQDWRQKVDVINDIDSTIRQILDEELPDDPYPPDLFTTKVQLVYDHVLTAYGDDGESAYSTKADVMWGGSPVVVDFGGPVDPYTVAEEAVDRIHRDPAFAAYVAEQLAQSK